MCLRKLLLSNIFLLLGFVTISLHLLVNKNTITQAIYTSASSVSGEYTRLHPLYLLRIHICILRIW